MHSYRDDFPIFTSHPRLVYLDSAATSQKPAVVIDAVADFYRTANANVHRSLYPLGLASSEAYEGSRETVRAFLNASASREIIFTRSATDGINLLAATLTDSLQKDDEILLSVAEHHSNLIPWQQAAVRHGLKLVFVSVTERGDIDLSHLTEMLTPKTKIISLTHCSNVLGRFLDIPSVKKIISKQGSDAVLVVDASQSAPHLPLDVQALGCDFLVFSGHKAYGPSGIGVLWGRESLLQSLPPYQTGGDMIKTVSLETATWNDLPWKFEAGTPNIEGAVGLAAALTYLMKITMYHVAEHTAELAEKLIHPLRALPEITIIGEPDLRSGIISFSVNGMHPHDLADLLGKEDICIRAGHQCAAPLHEELDIAASNRASIGLYTTEQDIDTFLKSLKNIVSDFTNA